MGLRRWRTPGVLGLYVFICKAPLCLRVGATEGVSEVMFGGLVDGWMVA